MNREQEHYTLKNEIFSTPASLDNVIKTAEKRALKRTIRNSIIMPLGMCAAVFILFVGLVNFSPAVASAMERIPGLQKLAEFVTYSPLFSDAVEHGHVQSLGLEQVIGEDLIMRVEHIIVDGQYLHILYELESSKYINFSVGIGARGSNADSIPDCCMDPAVSCFCYDDFIQNRGIISGPSDVEPGQLRYHAISFYEAVPRIVIWEGTVRDRNSGTNLITSDLIGSYKFVIEIDETFTHQDIIEVNCEFEIEGQHMKITTVELNPVHTRVNIETDWANNTEQLQRLVFYMENENGDRFEPPAINSGVGINLPAGGTGDSENGDFPYSVYGPRRMETHFLESAFFSESESLTIYITGVEWMSMEWMGPDTIILDEPISISVK